MPSIETENRVVTHINLLTVARDKQQALIDSRTETVNAARNVPG
jgi:hypothetical protein